MRVLYITQWFEPEPAFKGLTFAEKLRERGCSVRVVTGFPNYPGGKLYPGYRLRFFQREKMGEIIVDRVPLFPSHDRSGFGRAINYISFAASLFVYGLLTGGRHDVIYAYHPPLTVALAAVTVGLLRRKPVVVDVQDLWPDTLKATGMMSGGRLLALVDLVCRLVYRGATKIIVQSPGFRRRLLERAVPEEKIVVVLNWALESMTTPKGQLDLGALGFEGRFNVMFAGTMGPAQGLDVVLDAARQVAAAEPVVQFVLVGDGIDSERLRGRITSERLDNIRFLPRVPIDQIADILAAADVLLVTLTSDPLFDITIPSKTQFYLCAGKPVLMSAGGDAAHLIRQARAGIATAPGDAKALANAVLVLARKEAVEIQEMGRHGRDYYYREMSFGAGVDKTMRILIDALGCRDAPDKGAVP